MSDCEKQLRSMCDSIAESIEQGRAFGWDEKGDYLEAYSYSFVISSEKRYEHVRVMVAGGGPNIWIDTKHQEVEGYWGGDKEILYYHKDEMDIDGALREIFACT